MSTTKVNIIVGALAKVAEGCCKLPNAERYRNIHLLQAELRTALNDTHDPDEKLILAPLVTADPDHLGRSVGQVAVAWTERKKPATTH